MRFFFVTFLISILLFLLLPASIVLGKDDIATLEGIIEASETVELGTQSPGIVEKILVERGDYVKKGQKVVLLKSDLEKIEVRLAQAQIKFYKSKLERSQGLFKKKLAAEIEKEELETELKIRRLELEKARELLKLKTITSPVNGIVLNRQISPGEFVEQTVHMLVITQLDPLFVEVIAPVELIGRVRKGMKARIVPESPADREYIATVTIVDQVVDAASGTFGIRLQLPNPNLSIHAGLKCKVHFLGNLKDALRQQSVDLGFSLHFPGKCQCGSCFSVRFKKAHPDPGMYFFRPFLGMAYQEPFKPARQNPS